VASQSKRAKAHHVLPQFYLRAWRDGDGKVAMLNRDGREIETGTRALAVENDFYAVTDQEGNKSSVVETKLAEWDGEAAAAHAALLRDEFPLEKEQREALGCWLGLQWLRGRSSRANGEELYDKLTKMVIQFGLERNSSEGESPEPPVSQQIGDVGPGFEIPILGDLPDNMKADLADQDSYRVTPTREEQITQMLNSLPVAPDAFLETEWHLLRFQGHPLLTSDEPIILQRRPSPENALRGVGPASADSLYVPISPARCLALIRTGPSGSETIRDLPDQEAKNVNRSSVRTMWSQLFRHPKGTAFPNDIPPLPKERIIVG